MSYNWTKYIRYLLLVFLALPASVCANDSNEWAFTATPYLWITGQEGKVSTLPPAAPAEMDVSFSDVISSMDMSLMGLVETRKGRFGLFTEVFYVGISTDSDTPGRFYTDADYEQDLWGISLGGSYELSQSNNYELHVVGGVRHWDLDNKFELNAGLLPSRVLSERETWSDVFTGLRGKAEINENWYMSGWGVAAVAGDSDSSLDIYGGVGYKHNDTLSISVGYRHQEVDYDDGLFLFDVEMSGPAIGVTYRF